MSASEDRLKAAAARSAVALVRDGMVVGLGSGTTATFAIRELGARVKAGLRIRAVPTSERTAAEAQTLGIPIVTLDEERTLDLTIDGADQVERGSLDLIKGLGGALLREKIVACASRRLVIIVHAAKLVARLARRGALPVEVVPFGWQATAERLVALGAAPVLRRQSDASPVESDGGHFILDCTFAAPVAARALARRLDHVVGLVEHGFFIGLATEVHVAGEKGVRVLMPDRGRRR